jgi:hypothetical protein
MAEAYAGIIANKTSGPVILGGKFTFLQLHNLLNQRQVGPSAV